MAWPTGTGIVRCALVSLLCLRPLIGWAAEAEVDAIVLPEEPDPAPEPPANRVLEDIVVTAQKMRQALRDVPAAVSVVDPETLRNAGVIGPEGLENFVPNVELDMDPSAPTTGMRGFSTATYNIGLEPSVGVIIDEIPITRPELIHDGMFDVGRIEVLRGPQGTLFGKNTIAGVLIFHSQPPAAIAGGQLQLTASENNGRFLEGALDLPATEALHMRGALLSWHEPGQLDNSFLDRRELAQRRDAARLRMDWRASPTLAMQFGAQFTEIDTHYSPWQLYDLDPDALAYARSRHARTEDDPFDAHTAFDLPGFVRRQSHIAHAIADWTTAGGLTVTTIVGLAGGHHDILMDIDVSAADLASLAVDTGFRQQSLEWRLAGSRSPGQGSIDFVGGLFALRADVDGAAAISLGDDLPSFALSAAGMEALGAPQGLPLPALVPGAPPGVFDDGVNQRFVQESLALAAFGQLEWALAERITLIAGLRLGHETKDAVIRVVTRPQPAQASLTASVLQAENFTRELSRREPETSPKLGLRYRWSDQLSGYASWTRGFKSGGFNGQSLADQREPATDGSDRGIQLAFEPERGDNYEMGLRARLAGGALSIHTTLYHTDVNDMQVTSFNGINFEVFNAARSRLRGIESELRWLTPLSWLTIDSTLAIARARYRSYPDAPAAAESDDGSGIQDLSGRTLPKAPRLTLSLHPRITLPLGRQLILQWGLDISHRGDQYVEVDLDSHSFQSAYTLIGSHLAIGPHSGRWGLILRGENLTSAKALSFVGDHNLFADSYFATQIPLQRMSATITTRW